MECWFNDNLELNKGDIIKILRAFPNDVPLRVTEIENATRGWQRLSRDEGIIMTRSSIAYQDPVIGKVISSKIRVNKITEFMIEEGAYENHVFVKAGQILRGQDALINIFKNQLDTYLKVWDPYISPETIKLLSNAPIHIEIQILTEKIYDLPPIKQEISRLKNKVTIKKFGSSHDRFIFTKGEGWTIGHSLKDFGKKYSQLTKLTEPAYAESSFDTSWIQSVTV